MLTELQIFGLVIMYTLGGLLIECGIIFAILSFFGINPTPWKK